MRSAFIKVKVPEELRVDRPKLSLGNTPTPLEKWNITNLIPGAECYIKRDDMSGSGLTGNKVRKLEFIFADVLNQGCDSVITYGGATSNHTRATAICAARTGVQAHLMLRGADPNMGSALYYDS